MQSTAEKKKMPPNGTLVGDDVVVYLKVPRRLHLKLVKTAKKEDRTLASVIREALSRYYR